MKVIVAGALANKPGNGGGAWERMSWAVGLRRLGFDVYFVEQIGAAANPAQLEWFRSATDWFGFGERSALIIGDERCVGVPWDRLLEIADGAELLVNLSGHLTLESLLRRIRRKAYVDVDPGFTQFWHADPGTAFKLEGHDYYFTIGENIGTPGCAIPTSGIRWRPTRQPVVLDDWPVMPAREPRRFTTIASWRGAFGPVEFGGRRYGVKAHEFRKFVELPQRVGDASFEIALDIHPADGKDLASLKDNGWHIADPKLAAGDAAAFRRYVQVSAAEFSVAQGVYVDTDSGWFSDRSVRYLASGRPVLVQDTGFGRHIPTGQGLLSFRTLDEAAAGVEAILGDYESHCRGARAIATEYFDSDKVLGRFLDEVGVAP